MRFLVWIPFVLSVFIPSETVGKPFSNSRFANINGVVLHYRIWQPCSDTLSGNVLFVHGFSGSTYSWQVVADSLSRRGYRAVALDVPPFGYSDRNPRLNSSVTARARLLHQFLSELFPDEKWTLAGHSMGGGIVQAVGHLYPEKVTGICFVAPALFKELIPSQANPPLWMRVPGATTIVGNLAETWFITPRRIKKLLNSAYGSEPSNDAIKAYIEPLLVPGTARAILNMQRFNANNDSLNIRDLKLPIIAIWGRNDTWVPLEPRSKLLADLPNAILHILNNAGHNPMETHPDEFLSLIISFLEINR